MKNIRISCPISHSSDLRKEILNAGAGKNGNYSHCSGMYEVEGSFIPGNGSNPMIGEIGKLEKTREHIIETTCSNSELSGIVEVIKKFHPYETPHIEVTDIELF